MIDFLKDIFHINSLKRCLAHVERFIKDCSGLRPTVLDKRSLLRDGGKEAVSYTHLTNSGDNFTSEQ